MRRLLCCLIAILVLFTAAPKGWAQVHEHESDNGTRMVRSPGSPARRLARMSRRSDRTRCAMSYRGARSPRSTHDLRSTGAMLLLSVTTVVGCPSAATRPLVLA